MAISTLRMRTVAAGVLIVAGAVACDGGRPVDEALTRDLAAAAGASGDLELAPRASRPQAVVSAIEGGPAAAPTPAPRPVRREAKRPVERQAAQPTVPHPQVETRAAAPVVEPVPTSAPTQIEPPPLPPATQGPTTRQPGVFKTEAEVLRQRPWIRP